MEDASLVEVSAEPLPEWLDSIGEEARFAQYDFADESFSAHVQPDASCVLPERQPEGKRLSSKELNDLRTLTAEASFGNVSSSSLELPWETPQMKLIFNDSAHLELPKLDPLHDDDLALVFVQPKGTPCVEVGQGRIFDRAFTGRFKSRDLGGDEQLEYIFEKWLLVVLQSPEHSQIGRVIGSSPKATQLEAVRDVLGGKSMSTLRKRLRQTVQLVSWSTSEETLDEVFPITAGIVRRYLKYLTNAGKGHSVLQGAMENFRFLHHVVGIDMDQDALNSVWAKGLIRNSLQCRKKRKQSRALLVSELQFFENFLKDDRNTPQDRYVAGCCLFAVYSRARVGDLANVEDVSIDMFQRHDGSWYGYIEIQSNSHKMRATSDALGLNLLLIAPVQGVTDSFWGREFLKVAEAVGLPLHARIPCSRPLLPVPDGSGAWTNRPSDSSEVGKWLTMCLTGSGFDTSGLSAHGMKATTLSFLSKWGANPDDRTILGHHSLKHRSSLECYSREIQAGPLRVLESCLKDIRAGAFKPDLSRSGYFSGEAPSEPGPQLRPTEVNEDLLKEDFSSDGNAIAAEGSEEADDSSSSSSSSSDVDDVETLEQCAKLSEASEEKVWKEGCQIYQNTKTKKLHLKPEGPDDTPFVCGRKMCSDHQPFCGKILMEGLKCMQCEKGRPVRTTEGLAEAMDRALKRCRIG